MKLKKTAISNNISNFSQFQLFFSIFRSLTSEIKHAHKLKFGKHDYIDSFYNMSKC